MDLGLQGKTALVVAASAGIGRGVAAALAREGCRVLIASSDPERIERARHELSEHGDIEAHVLDVRSAASVREVASALLAAHQRIDILVTNGPGPPVAEAGTVSDEQLNDALQANLLSAVHLIRAFLPPMIEAGFGRIIVLASTTAIEPDEGMVLSNLARAALLAYAKTLSREVAGHGITVNSVLTGSVLTARSETLLRGEADDAGVSYEEMLQTAAETIPVGRISTVEEFVPAIAFLASPLAGYINGVALPIDGGTMRSL